MESLSLFGTRLMAGNLYLPAPDNNNWRLMEEGKTPAEFMQWLKATREEMRRERAADPSLRHSPKHRRHWETLDAMEKCCLWHHYGVR